MSDQNPSHGNPIPNAEINQNPNAGRRGPIVNLPLRTNRDGRPDHSSHPGLNLAAIRREHQVEGSNASTNLGGSGGEGSSTDGKQNTLADDDAADDSDFELLEHPVMTPPDSPQTEQEAYATTSLLTEKVPPELISGILDYAEYFPHSVIGKREDKVSVGNNGSKVYLTATIPEFDAMEKDTAGKGGDEGIGGRPGRVRKLVFKISSNDQGWSSYSQDHKTYRGAWSWTELELWRKGTRSEGVAATDQTSETVEEEDDEEKKAGERQRNAGKYKVGSWLLQRNKHAEREPTHHEVVWDWKVDKFPREEGEEELEPELEEGWEKDGRIANGKFVRDLKGGDELRVVMHARYPGWRCTVEKCEIECWWAV